MKLPLGLAQQCNTACHEVMQLINYSYLIIIKGRIKLIKELRVVQKTLLPYLKT
jgi:hypothetical protein